MTSEFLLYKWEARASLLRGLVYRIYKSASRMGREVTAEGIMGAMTDTSQYEILFDRKDGEYISAGIGGIRTKTVRAGDTIEVECYPLTRIGAGARHAFENRKRQRKCQEAINRRNAEKKLRRYIEHNFTGEDWVITLTWDYGMIDRTAMSSGDANRLHYELGLPVDEEDARRALTNYFRRIKTRMRQAGEDPRELKHIYVLEITGPKSDGFHHYHFHLVLHAPGLTDLQLKALWPAGFCRTDRLSLRSEGAARIANYLTKQHTTEALTTEGKRLRRWGRSKNLADPVETVSDRKISRRRAAAIAADVQRDGREIFAAIYPGYQCVEAPTVRFSDFIAGAYIFARLRKVDMGLPWERNARRRQ